VVEQAVPAQAQPGAGAAPVLWGPDTPGAVGTLELRHRPAPARPVAAGRAWLSHLSQTVEQALAAGKTESDIGISGSTATWT
jgi:hypothetical protein